LFPPGDPRWQGADSGDLLQDVVSRLTANWTICNIDLMIVGEYPRIAPRRAEMRHRISELLAVDVDRVSVKATTNEKLGALGRGEGLAALAVVMLEERDSQ
jgi:2-C-methyl-D-erythritol 2,4-cyclodiphosphate synthase